MTELFSQQQQFIKNLIEESNERLEFLLREGLKKKGFNFRNKADLCQFIKDRCSCNSSGRIEMYLVDGDVFLIFKHPDNSITMGYSENGIKASVDMGSYAFPPTKTTNKTS